MSLPSKMNLSKLRLFMKRLILLCLISSLSLANKPIGNLEVSFYEPIPNSYRNIVVKAEGVEVYSSHRLLGEIFIVTTHTPKFMGWDYAVEHNNIDIFPLDYSNLVPFKIPNHDNEVIAFVESTFGTGGGKQRFLIIDTITGEVAEQTVASFDPIIWKDGVVFQPVYAN